MRGVPAEQFLTSVLERIPEEELTERVTAIYGAWYRGEIEFDERNREFDYLRAARPICFVSGCFRSAQIEGVCGKHLGQR